MSSKRKVIIFEYSPIATQSGEFQHYQWHIKFVNNDHCYSFDNEMSWTSSNDMQASEIHTKFITKEQAIKYAENNNLNYVVVEKSKSKNIKNKSYADNFKNFNYD